MSGAPYLQQLDVFKGGRDNILNLHKIKTNKQKNTHKLVTMNKLRNKKHFLIIPRLMNMVMHTIGQMGHF